MNTNIGKKVLIRGNRSGVEFGELVSQNGSEVTLKNARRIWYWDGAASLSQLSKDGTSNPSNCKFTVFVDSITKVATTGVSYDSPTVISFVEIFGRFVFADGVPFGMKVE